MLDISGTGKILGAEVRGIDLRRPLPESDRRAIMRALGRYGVLCFPEQDLEPAHLKAFSEKFGRLEINVAANPEGTDHPEVMTLSNIVEDGKPIGLADAGQDWHTDMSYSREIAFANVLHAITVPRRDGRALGGTRFANMHAAYDALPDDFKLRFASTTATHDFNKFWEEMRRRPGSTRAPLTDEQRRRKPPVQQPLFLTHPITRRKVLYANPGYAVAIDGLPEDESEDVLAFLFSHQTKDEFVHTHEWTEGDVLMWDNIGTIHNANADYGPDTPRLIKRCQVQADRIFDEGPALSA